MQNQDTSTYHTTAHMHTSTQAAHSKTRQHTAHQQRHIAAHSGTQHSKYQTMHSGQVAHSVTLKTTTAATNSCSQRSNLQHTAVHVANGGCGKVAHNKQPAQASIQTTQSTFQHTAIQEPQQTSN